MQEEEKEDQIGFNRSLSLGYACQKSITLFIME
jgi:hypothetical protein